MKDLYSIQQIRDIEVRVGAEGGITESELMERAGQAAFALIRERWPGARNIAVCCGKGNNAGDGFVLARLLKEAGLSAHVYCVAPLSEVRQPTAKNAADRCSEANVLIEVLSDAHPPAFSDADLIVDALLGTGLNGAAGPLFDRCIRAINQAHEPVLSLDVPSGLNADTGEAAGACVTAEVTLTFLALKRGLFTYQAPTYCGIIQSHDLGVSRSYFEVSPPCGKLLSDALIPELLLPRRRDAHKGDYGHALIIGGDYGMGGAVRMAAEAAMRVGAGLVTVATRPEHLSVVSGARPEIMCEQVAEPSELDPVLKRISVILIGPGLGKSEWARGLLEYVLKQPQPKVLDADALNLLSETPVQRDDWVLTPHPGEAGRLMGCENNEIQADRFKAAQALQEKYQGVIVLKGAGTIIQSGQPPVHLCGAGNPGMASGGMGDILSGVVAGLVSQKLALNDAANLAVFIHSRAADLAASQGGERGMLASDLLDYIRQLANPQ